MVLPRNDIGEEQMGRCRNGLIAIGCGRDSKEMEYHEVVDFLRNFKPLECECCDQILGYMERKTGRVICNPAMRARGIPTVKQLQAAQASVAVALSGNGYNGNISVTDEAKAVYETIVKTSSFEVPHGIGDEGRDFVDGQKLPTANGLSQLTDKFTMEMEVTASNQMRQGRMENELNSMSLAQFQQNLAPQLKDKLEETEETRDETGKLGRIVPFEVVHKPNPLPFPVVSSEFRWNGMKYSHNLVPGASVQVTHSWAVNKYHVVATLDVDLLDALNFRIETYVENNPDKKIKRCPERNDIVLGKYIGSDGTGDGDFYRARVLESSKGGCEVEFIDYGDSEFVEYSNIYEVNADLMTDVVYGLRVSLLCVPDGDYKGIEKPEKLKDITEEPFVLDLNDEIEPDETGGVIGTLWLGDDCLNDIVLDHLKHQGKICGNR